MTTVIAICHQKGGVAKTTTTLGLAGAFAELGAATLMVDLDPQANLTSGVGLDANEMKASIADVLSGDADLGSARVETRLPRLELVPSSESMFSIGRSLYQEPEFEYRLREVLKGRAADAYDVVLLDCPPSVGPLTMNALTAADLMIIPTQCEYFSIQALADVFELVSLIRARTNPGLVYRLLVTMYDGRGTFHARMLEQLREHFRDGLLNTVVGFDTKLRESQLAGTPISLHAPYSRSASQYRQLAEELESYVKQHTQVQAA